MHVRTWRSKIYTHHASEFTDHASEFTDHASEFTDHASEFTDHASEFTDHASEFTDHASEFTDHASEFTDHASEFTDHVSEFTDHASEFTDHLLICRLACFRAVSVSNDRPGPVGTRGIGAHHKGRQSNLKMELCNTSECCFETHQQLPLEGKMSLKTCNTHHSHTPLTHTCIVMQ